MSLLFTIYHAGQEFILRPERLSSMVHSSDVLFSVFFLLPIRKKWKIIHITLHLLHVMFSDIHTKYEVSISYCSKVMAKVKVFCHRVTDRHTERTKTRCPWIPFQRHKNVVNVSLIRESSFRYLKWLAYCILPGTYILLETDNWAVAWENLRLGQNLRFVLFCKKIILILYSELIGSKNDNIQVLPTEIQEFPSTSWSKSTSSSSKFTSSILHWWRNTLWQY